MNRDSKDPQDTRQPEPGVKKGLSSVLEATMFAAAIAVLPGCPAGDDGDTTSQEGQEAGCPTPTSTEAGCPGTSAGCPGTEAGCPGTGTEAGCPGTEGGCPGTSG